MVDQVEVKNDIRSLISVFGTELKLSIHKDYYDGQGGLILSNFKL